MTHFTNARTLMGFIWRRDRVRIPIWIVSIVSITLAVALSFPELYPPGPERDMLATTLKNPAMTAMLGPGYGLDNYHIGAAMAHQMLLFSTIAVAIMNILLGIRHTRRDEEAGRIEVIRSLPVGKLANPSATFLVLVMANLVLAVITGVSLALLGLEGMDLAGSLLYGAALGITGIFFAAATILIAQLTETARGAMGLSFSLLGVSYLLRAVGDLGSEALSLISPLGLMLRTKVYAQNTWWPMIVMCAASVILILLAFRLNSMRDLEAGFIAARPGAATASPLLQSPLGLALRLQQTTIVGWTAAMFILGVTYGSVFGEIDAFFQTSDIFELLLPMMEGFSLTEQFTATLLAVMTMIGLIPVLLIMLKLRSEELANRTEHLLARAVSRRRLMGSYLIMGLFLAVLGQIVSVLGLWSASATVLDQPLSLASTLQASLAYVPSMWIMLGLTVLMIGFVPKLASLIWLYLGYTFFVIYFGGLLRLPGWLSKTTPLGFVPNVPMEPMSLSRIVVMVLAAFTLLALGMAGYEKRDIYG
ncbi:MAG: ABC transporter permease [Limnochordia bacterium]